MERITPAKAICNLRFPNVEVYWDGNPVQSITYHSGQVEITVLWMDHGGTTQATTVDSSSNVPSLFEMDIDDEMGNPNDQR